MRAASDYQIAQACYSGQTQVVRLDLAHSYHMRFEILRQLSAA